MHMYNFTHILACVTIFNRVYAIQLKGRQTLTTEDESTNDAVIRVCPEVSQT